MTSTMLTPMSGKSNKGFHFRKNCLKDKCITRASTSNSSISEKEALQGLPPQLSPSQRKMHYKRFQLKFLSSRENALQEVSPQISLFKRKCIKLVIRIAEC